MALEEMSENDFDAFYGKGMYALVQDIINDLAPKTAIDYCELLFDWAESQESGG